jgi:hypothetical protein
MKAFCKTFVLLLATVGLASCGGGGGGGSNSSFEPVSQVVTVAATPGSVTTNSFTTVVVTVKQQDGAPAPDGETVNLSLTPLTAGTVSGGAGTASGTTASNSTSGGQASFIFNSSNQVGTAHVVASVTVIATGSITGTSTFTGSANINVTQGTTQDPRLQLTATTQVLPLNPFIGLATTPPNFETNFLGSPYIAEVGVVWRHSNGALVSGSLTVNDSVTPTTIALLSELDDPNTQFDGLTQTPPSTHGNEFLTLVGSEPVFVTGGVGTIYVHSTDHPGQAIVSVTAIDPDNGQTINSQMVFTVAGPATGVPSSVVASSNGGAYISGSNGPQSTVISATVFDGSDSFVTDPNGVDNVQFSIVGPANNDGRLAATNAAGQLIIGTTVSATTHNGIATATFQTGTQQGPVQIKMTADRADNNVDNGISDPVSATTTVVVSDGKLYSLTIDSPDTGAINSTGVSDHAVQTPSGSGNYQLNLSAKGVDRQGNPVLQSTVIGWGDVDSPQVVTAGTGPQGWFQISGSRGDPQEGGKSFVATAGHFKTAGGGSGPGDTLLVIGKASEGAPALNDDLESSDKITSVLTDTSLTVATPFNLNDKTGVVVNNHDVLPYIIGRATFSSVQSPSFTDDNSNTSSITGVAVTTLNYPASQIGKAVAVWAQGTGTNTNTSPGLTDVVADIAVFALPGSALNAFITASPDPILGNTQQFETVCYYDGNNRPIPNYDISFSFFFNGVGSGSADGVNNAGKFTHLTGANGCVTVPIITASVPPPSGATTQPSITFSAGPTNANSTSGGSQATVTVPIVVNAAQLQVSCPSGVVSGTGTNYIVNLHLIDSAGAGISGSGITAACTATPPGSITAGTILLTDATGNTQATITVNPTGTVGRCVFQSSAFGNLVASINFSATGAGTCNGGFSPPPN